MDELSALREENAQLKTTLDVLLSKLSAARAESEQLKKDVVSASLPKLKITPARIEITNENIERLIAGLKEHLHPNAMRKKKLTVAIQLLLMHNQGVATAPELLKATGLSYGGFSRQSTSTCKAGLIAHPSYRKFMLTDKSKEILNKVFGE